MKEILQMTKKDQNKIYTGITNSNNRGTFYNNKKEDNDSDSDKKYNSLILKSNDKKDKKFYNATFYSNV
jgi:hypothetical protein